MTEKEQEQDPHIHDHLLSYSPPPDLPDFFDRLNEKLGTEGVAQPATPLRRRMKLKAVLAVAASIVVVAALIGVQQSNPSSDPNNSARSVLLAAAKSEPHDVVVASGQYLHRRELRRTLITNGREYFNQFTIGDTWEDAKGAATTQFRSSDNQPLNLPLPSDLQHVERLENYKLGNDQPSPYTDATLPARLSGDRAADKRAIDEEINKRLEGSDRPFEQWWVISHLLTDNKVSSSARPVIFSLAADLPGLRAQQHVADSLNRTGTQISARCELGLKCELLFDPATAEVLELRQVIPDNDTTRGPAGQIYDATTYLEPEVVDSLPDGVSLTAPDYTVPAPTTPAPDVVPSMAWQTDGSQVTTDPSKAVMLIEAHAPDGVHDIKLWESPEIERTGRCFTITSNMPLSIGDKSAFPQPRCVTPQDQTASSSRGDGASWEVNGRMYSVFTGEIPGATRISVQFDNGNKTEATVKDGVYLYFKDGDAGSRDGGWTLTGYDATGKVVQTLRTDKDPTE